MIRRIALLFQVLLLVLYGARAADNDDPCSKLSYKKPTKEVPEVIVYSKTDKSALCRAETSGRISRISKEDHFVFDDSYAYDRRLNVFHRADRQSVRMLGLHPRSAAENKWTDSLGLSFDWILAVALDYIGRNLYVRSLNQVLVFDLRNTSKPARVLLDNLTFDTTLVSLQAFPKQGYLINQFDGVVVRYNLDGSDPRTLYRNPDTKIYATALDHYDQRVYWIERYSRNNKTVKKISYTDLSGAPARDVVIENLSVHKNLAVDEHYVYYAVEKDRTSYVRRAGKTDGEVDPDFEISIPEGKFFSVTVTSGQPQDVPPGHPCNPDGYCFAAPDAKGALVGSCR